MTRRSRCVAVGLVSAICHVGAVAQPAAPSFQWVTRTSEAEPNVGLDVDASLLPRGAGLRQIAVDRDFVRISDLQNGRWVPVLLLRHQIGGGRMSRVVESLDERNAYLWHDHDGLSIYQVGEDSLVKLLASLHDQRLRDLMYSQGNGRVHGDAVHGFWVTNNSLGAAVFIEPGTWAVREVPGFGSTRAGGLANKAFTSAALGADGSLWVLERASKDIVRRGAQGEELARLPWPFGEAAPEGVDRYGDGALALSEAGVLAISDTRLALASLGKSGQVLWRLAACPTGVHARCALEASRHGRLSTIQRAVADEAGKAWIADSTRSVFTFDGTGDPMRQFGHVPPCSPPSAPVAPGQAQAVPCVGAAERLVRLSDGRYLIYALAGGFSATHVLEVGAGRPPRIGFSRLAVEAADLPLVDRRAVVASVSDHRVWGFDEDTSGSPGDAQSRPLGVPTRRGLATASKMMRRYLSPPGDAIRTPEDSFLAQLFRPPPSFVPGSHSMARFGPDAVVIKDRRAPPTRLALYDMSTGQLRLGIVVQGLPQAGACERANSALEYVFNDDADTTYLMRESSGEVFVIDRSFAARLVARVPPATVGEASCMQPRHTGRRVPIAVLTPAGRLVIATAAGVFVQRSETFVPVAAPASVVQLVVLDEAHALAIGRGGLARLKLPD